MRFFQQMIQTATDTATQAARYVRTNPVQAAFLLTIATLAAQALAEGDMTLFCMLYKIHDVDCMFGIQKSCDESVYYRNEMSEAEWQACSNIHPAIKMC